MIKANNKNEPIIVTLGLITFLIGFFATQKISNKSTIKGNYNIIDQTNEKIEKLDVSKENQVEIEGNRNEIKQKN